ncbi:hypothetical protein [Camelliibacillus cellulosilyticus]
MRREGMIDRNVEEILDHTAEILKKLVPKDGVEKFGGLAIPLYQSF